MTERVELGSRVKDVVTGFEGIAVTRCEYLDGGVEVGVRAPAGIGDTELPKVEYIAEVQLQVIDEGIHIAPVERTIGFKTKDEA